MNTNANPFMNMDMSKMMNMDVTKMMADFDPAKIVEQFTTMTKMPTVDVDAIVDAQKKNLEALNAANKAAVEGVQALAQRQNEFFQEAIKEATAAVTDLGQSKDIEDVTVKQAELLKVSFEKALVNMKEIADMVAKSNADASQVINARITETLEDVRKQAVKIKKQSK